MRKNLQVGSRFLGLLTRGIIVHRLSPQSGSPLLSLCKRGRRGATNGTTRGSLVLTGSKIRAVRGDDARHFVRASIDGPIANLCDGPHTIAGSYRSGAQNCVPSWTRQQRRWVECPSLPRGRRGIDGEGGLASKRGGDVQASCKPPEGFLAATREHVSAQTLAASQKPLQRRGGPQAV